MTYILLAPFALNGIFDFQTEALPQILELLIQRIKTVGVGSLRHLKLFHFQQLVEKLNGRYVEILHAFTRASRMPNVVGNFAESAILSAVRRDNAANGLIAGFPA